MSVQALSSPITHSWIPPLGTTLLALAVYLLSLAPDLTWANYGGDGGELITAAVTLGIPHPPGYPTYVLLGKLVSYLPVGSIAYRFNLLSALAMALAAGFVTATRANDEPRTAGSVALAVGLLFALTPLVWSQALIAEVYALNLACLAAFLWALLGRRSPWLVGLLLGLSLTNHLTSLLMVPAAFLLTPRARWLPLGGGVLAGLTPLLALPWLATHDSPVPWGASLGRHGWWWLVSGRLYQSNVMGLPAAEFIPRLQQWAPVLLAQMAWLGLPLLFLARPPGFSRQAWDLAAYHRPIIRQPAPVLLATAVCYLLFAVGYASGDAILFALPALLLFSILLKRGAERLGRLVLVLPLLSLALNFSGQTLRQESAVRQQTERVWQQVPESAILLTAGDPAIFALWYFHHVEDQRPDLVLVDGNLFAFDWYRRHLAQRYPHLTQLQNDELDKFQQANQHRPVCLVSPGLSLQQCRSR